MVEKKNWWKVKVLQLPSRLKNPTLCLRNRKTDKTAKYVNISPSHYLSPSWIHGLIYSGPDPDCAGPRHGHMGGALLPFVPIVNKTSR